MALNATDATGRKLRYVYDGKVARILGRPVLTDENEPGVRFIYLTDMEAAMYIDLGQIGNTPLADLTADEAAVIRQSTGAPLTGDETPDPEEPDVSREATIDQPAIVDETPVEELPVE